MTDVVLAVDGGNSKTDLALVGVDGTVLAAVRGGGTSPHHLGMPAALARIDELYRAAVAEAGVEGPAVLGVLALAGADLPEEEVALQAAVDQQGWTARSVVRNDTFAVLRSGTDRTDRVPGVAVVCGAGINCVGVAPDGREARFLALGTVTGDWGGGFDLGLGALGAAVRADDGRAEATVLSRVVPEHFGRATAADVAIALHGKAVSGWRLAELSPAVLAAATDGDAAAGALVDRLADEVAAFAVAALHRLDGADAEADVVLGGGILRAGSARLDARIDAAVLAAAPHVHLVRAPHPPLAGCALMALDEVGVGPAASRLRAQFAAGQVVLRTPSGAASVDEPMRHLATG
jgi:N-acetylglucosamine kinase-like BadF-type ATPase